MEKEQTNGQRQTKQQLFGEIIRFLIVGGTATVADYATFYVFRQWILPARLIAGNTWDIISLIIATALGFLVGLVLNWILSVKFVFRDVRNKEEAKSAKSFWIFVII